MCARSGPPDIAARPYQSECVAGGRYGALKTNIVVSYIVDYYSMRGVSRGGEP